MFRLSVCVVLLPLFIIFLDPLVYKNSSLLLCVRVEHDWEAPLIGVGPGYVKIDEALFGGLSLPIESSLVFMAATSVRSLVLTVTLVSNWRLEIRRFK